MNVAVKLTTQTILIRCYFQPKASRDEIIGLHKDEVKIAITAPPVDGKANEHVVKFLAKQFGVAKSMVHIRKGALSRHKLIEIQRPKMIPDKIRELISDKSPV